MAEYPIIVGIDPQTGAGAQKVKQDLRGIQNEARATSTSLNQSFDQSKFDKTIGGLANRIEQVERSLNGLTATGQQAARGNDGLTQSLDRMTAAEFRAAGGMDGLNKQTKSTTGSQAQLEAALRRVLNAVDQSAAEQQRLNALLADGKRLLDAGIITNERYAQVQRHVAAASKEQVAVSGAQRIGMQQLGFQLGDIATMWSLGAKPAQIFGSQIGQVTQALQLMSDGSNRFLNILAGPWGVAFSVAMIVLAPFVGKLFEGNDALGEATDKLKKEAAETELNRRAKEAFNRTLDGQIARMRELNEELVKATKSQRDQANENLRLAQSGLANLRTGRQDALDDVREAQDKLEQLQNMLRERPPTGVDATGWTLGILANIEKAEKEVARLKKLADEATAAIAKGEEAVRAARVPIQEDIAKAAVDPIAGINRQYDIMVDKAKAAALGNESLSRALAGTLTQIERQREAAIKAAQAQEQLAKSTGVATFRSREQAIGIAGRELQRSGLKVSENNQFGGVRGNHPGMGNTAHGRFAIDVNEGVGVIEANVPEIRAKFDAAARRYAARGYKVLWNGNVYWPDGRTTRIPAGQHQHHDHMHLEAPGTIVGKATGASTEAQDMREAQALEKTQERAEDFVQGIVNRAASVGLPSDRKTQLAADVEEAFAEFQRRFERAPDFAEAWRIETALSDADARAIAQHFQEAYVDPLREWEQLEGLTGRQREIRLRQLREEKTLGRELTDVEKARIEAFVNGNAQAERQREILESIQGPIQQYRDTVATLNEMLASGAISQAQFNARVSELGASASQFKGGLPGMNANGVLFADEAAREQAAMQMDSQLAQLESFLAQGTILESEAASIRLAIWRQYQEELRQIDEGRLSNARDFFGQLSQLQNSKNREIAAVGKAAAVTTATIDAYVAINKALATLPPPFNIAMAGAIGATALANVASIVGLRQGGYTGDVGENQIAGMVPVHGREFVVNAEGTRRNRALLEAINSGQQVRQVGAAHAAQAASAAAPVVIPPGPPPQVNIRQINVTDPRQIADYFATPEGEQLFVNLISKNPEAVQRAASG